MDAIKLQETQFVRLGVQVFLMLFIDLNLHERGSRAECGKQVMPGTNEVLG